MEPIQIAANDRVFVLTGAGISVESGLAAFRSSDGLWAGHKVEEVCTPAAWENDPWKVWKFYSKRRADAWDAEPNAGHVALANLGEQVELFLCTQNVDSLHERSGSRDVAHMHGSLFQSRCVNDCRLPWFDALVYKSLKDVGACDVCGEMARPNITFFGEIPMHLSLIDRKLDEATVLLVVGTSGTVHPAARFVDAANKLGALTIYVGLENPLNFYKFSEIYLGNASEMQFQIT